MTPYTNAEPTIDAVNLTKILLKVIELKLQIKAIPTQPTTIDMIFFHVCLSLKTNPVISLLK